MDYTNLAEKLLQTVFRFYKTGSQKQLSRAAQGETFALQFIAQHNDTTVPSDIENEMSVSSARIAAVLNSLENKGLITRRIDSADRRRTILRLTEAGEERAAEETDKLLDAASGMLEYLGEKDASEYVRIMGRLADRCGSDAD